MAAAETVNVGQMTLDATITGRAFLLFWREAEQCVTFALRCDAPCLFREQSRYFSFFRETSLMNERTILLYVLVLGHQNTESVWSSRLKQL